MVEEQLKLVFEVPDVDFDGGEVEMALRWACDQELKDLWGESAAKYAVKILRCIGTRYNEALGGRYITERGVSKVSKEEMVVESGGIE